MSNIKLHYHYYYTSNISEALVPRTIKDVCVNSESCFNYLLSKSVNSVVVQGLHNTHYFVAALKELSSCASGSLVWCRLPVD